MGFDWAPLATPGGPRQSVKRALPRRDVTEGDGVSQQNAFPNEKLTCGKCFFCNELMVLRSLNL